MNYESFKKSVAAAAEKAGISEYELYSMEDESVSISAFQTEIENFSSSVRGGVCFRCIVNGKMGYAATELMDRLFRREIPYTERGPPDTVRKGFFRKGRTDMTAFSRLIPIALAALLLALPREYAPLPPPDGADFAPYQMTVPLEQPVEISSVSCPFGWRIHPISGELDFHTGIDLPQEEGTPIRAALGGVVEESGTDPSYGNWLRIDHGSGFSTLYAHCSRLLVKKGARVRRGERIARAGSTGAATGPHLHFEILLNGVRSGRSPFPCPKRGGGP